VLRNNLSLLLFLIHFVWVYGWSDLLAFYVAIQENTLQESFKDYVLCNVAMEDDCVNKHNFPIWMMYVFIVTSTNIGVCAFLLFGLQRRVALHWKKMITLVIKADFKSLTDLSIESYEKTVVVGSKLKVARISK